MTAPFQKDGCAALLFQLQQLTSWRLQNSVLLPVGVLSYSRNALGQYAYGLCLCQALMLGPCECLLLPLLLGFCMVPSISTDWHLPLHLRWYVVSSLAHCWKRRHHMSLEGRALYCPSLRGHH